MMSTGSAAPRHEVHDPAVRRPRDDVERPAAGAVGDRQELEVVVVVAELEAGTPRHDAGPLEVPGELLPHGGVPDRAVRAHAEERVDDVAAAEGPGGGERLRPGGRVERLRDAEVRGRRADAVPVEQRAEVGGAEPGGSGGLDLAVADLPQPGDRARGVLREDVTDRVELDADLVDRHAPPPAVPGGRRGRGHGRGGQRPGADGPRDGSGRRGRAEEPAAAEQACHLLWTGEISVISAHVSPSGPAGRAATTLALRVLRVGEMGWLIKKGQMPTSTCDASHFVCRCEEFDLKKSHFDLSVAKATDE
jgi:hypothetical protein